METSTRSVSEEMEVRVSFLVLVAVIAVCSTNASAKAVASATEDEANSAGHGPVEQGPQKDTAFKPAVRKSNTHGGEHVLIKRQIIPDPGRGRSLTSKKFDKARKSGSKKYKYDELKTRTVTNKAHSVRRDKYESQRDKTRYGRVPIGEWYLSPFRPKISLPQIEPDRDYYPWAMQANFQANVGGEEYEPKIARPQEIMRVEDVVDVLHNSMKEALESLFEALAKEYKKKLGREGAPAGSNVNARSSFIDTGDGPGESESADGTYDAVSPDNCSDDSPTAVRDSGNAPNDMSKRSESSLEYLKETLPVIVKAAETVLGDSSENTRSFGGGGVVGDDGMHDRRSVTWGTEDEDAEFAPSDGIDNGKVMPWDYDDLA